MATRALNASYTGVDIYLRYALLAAKHDGTKYHEHAIVVVEKNVTTQELQEVAYGHQDRKDLPRIWRLAWFLVRWSVR